MESMIHAPAEGGKHVNLATYLNSCVTHSLTKPLNFATG